MTRQLLLSLALLLASATVHAENGCMMMNVTSPTIVIDRVMGHARGFITVAMTCTDGLAVALESPLTPGGMIELSSGSGGLLMASIRDDATDAPLGPMTQNEQLGFMGTGRTQSITLRVEVHSERLPQPGQYTGAVVLNLEY